MDLNESCTYMSVSKFLSRVAETFCKFSLGFSKSQIEIIDSNIYFMCANDVEMKHALEYRFKKVPPSAHFAAFGRCKSHIFAAE